VSFLCLVFAVRSINYRYIMYCKSVTLNYSRCESYNWNIFQFWIILYNVHGIHKSCEVVSLWCASGSGYGIKKNWCGSGSNPFPMAFIVKNSKKFQFLCCPCFGSATLFYMPFWRTELPVFFPFKKKLLKELKQYCNRFFILFDMYIISFGIRRLYWF
jgi:hypothetical protein